MSDELSKGIFATLQDRRITKEVCQHYGVKVKAVKGEDDQPAIVKHYYPYYDAEGNHIANKIRDCKDKTAMPWEGKPKKATLFGQNVCSKGNKEQARNKIITITE